MIVEERARTGWDFSKGMGSVGRGVIGRDSSGRARAGISIRACRLLS